MTDNGVDTAMRERVRQQLHEIEQRFNVTVRIGQPGLGIRLPGQRL